MTGLAVFSLLAAAVFGFALLWQRRRHRQELDVLEAMLENAVAGHFSETVYDESRCSALQNRMAQYLSATELSVKRLDEEKRRIQELITEIAHQTRTPMANIRLYEELLEEEPLSQSAEESLRMLRAQSEKLQFLMEALVKVSRLETGVFVLHPKKGRLELAVQALVDGYRARFAQKGLAIAEEYEETLCFFDEKWTKEALATALDNALKYTKTGTVTIRVFSYELFACVQIEDTGVGIAEEDLPKIFERFYRGGNVRELDGVGIGLYLARCLMEKQGGYMQAASEETGAVFSFFFPKEM